MNSPTTSMYLKQKQSSFIILDSLARNNITNSISTKRINRQRDSLNTTDEPTHANISQFNGGTLLSQKIKGIESNLWKQFMNAFHLSRKKKMKIVGTTNTITRKKQKILVVRQGLSHLLIPAEDIYAKYKRESEVIFMLLSSI